MKEVFYKCSLMSDVVLNSSLATEGNMNTLDYIPGSNFLGMVASKLYARLSSEEAFAIFHSGLVSFGDATISKANEVSYPLPFSLYMDKLNKEIGTNTVYLHHLVNTINHPKNNDGARLQLKQERLGYVFEDGKIVKNIEKNIAIKSAQDRTLRTSKEGAMFGFESLEKGQKFVFSIRYNEEKYIAKVEGVLKGTHRLGKSKNAEFGQVKIEKNPLIVSNVSSFQSADYILVYAQSNLCFINDFGQSTFEPTAEQLGLNAGTIDWSKSQIRTHSYSPWNSKRNTTSTQRDCILKGSVFYVEGGTISAKSNQLGLHQAEGLGRVLYNPVFLKEGTQKPEAATQFSVYQIKKAKDKVLDPKTVLGKFALRQQKAKELELEISNTIHTLIYNNDKRTANLIKISSSQWGGIRAYATKAKTMDELYTKLFDNDDGYLTHGVADDKYWGRNKGANRKYFEELFKEKIKLGTVFIAKFAAEMAKENKRTEKKRTKNGK
jgi:hypothetical protein